MTDDDGTGTTGTIINNAWKQELYNQIDATLLGAAGVTANYIHSTAVGTVNNLACGSPSLQTVILLENATPITLTGVQFSATPRLGDLLVIQGRGAQVSLPHIAGTSTHQFVNYVGSAPTPLTNGGTATYIWTNGYWCMCHHEQGSWITPPFNAADYFGINGLTWTVAAGDVRQARYRLSGRTLQWTLSVTGVIGGAASPYAMRNVFGGYSVRTLSAEDFTCAYPYADSLAVGTGYVQQYTTQLQFMKGLTTPAWGVGAIIIRACGICEVT